MMDQDDTIAAIATAAGEAGIAVVRVSGPAAFEIADRIVHCPGAPPSRRPSRTFAHGRVRGDGSDIDEVLVLFMRAPASYTREDTIEIQGHGGGVNARRILRAALQAGARPAEPGEFTRRAFLNGRIDLTQAEAVLDLIHARSERAAAAAMEQLEGGLSRGFNRLYDELIVIGADLEATLDFPEEGLPETVLSDIVARLRSAASAMARMIDTWDEGHLLRDGALAVISGRPNVGKSTLLNALLDQDRAMVSEIPGTTRDVIEESLVLNGIPLRLVDTAGLRESTCELEREGVRRTRLQRERADLHLYVIDGAAPLEDEDRRHLQDLQPHRTVLVVNKADLGCRVAAADLGNFTRVSTSMVDGAGLEELKRILGEKLEGGQGGGTKPRALVSERHRRLLVDAQREVEATLDLLQIGAEDQIVLAAARVRDALESIGLATGRTYNDELLDAIFSKFCIGK
jgi:tRNA modification GTPase